LFKNVKWARSYGVCGGVPAELGLLAFSI